MRRSRWLLGVGVFATSAALCGGCSILFRADADQCSTSSDCTARGATFAGYTCAGGTCVAPVATVTPEGGVDADPGCTSNGDCHPSPTAQAQNHLEVACDVDTHACLQLTSNECPYVIGDYTGTTAPPIFLGAFATFPASGPTSHPSYLNYAFALNEFDVTSSGVPAGLGTGRRMPVAVACNDGLDTAGLGTAMTHLINDVHVPSIVAALPSAALSQVFSTYASEAKSDIFVINPFSWDSNLTSLTTSGLLWSMLGQPGDVAPAYTAFLPALETYVRTSPLWTLGSTAPMRIATVTANATDLNDLASAVEPVLVWNGGKSTTADTSNYLSVVLSDSTLNGTPVANIDVGDSTSGAEGQILQFQPQVIVSFASEEFFALMSKLEIDWPSGPLPFYLVGSYNMGSTTLQTDLQTNRATLPQRVAGIGVASSSNSQVLNQYNQDFLSYLNGPTSQQDLGQENYYDAMYFAVYSLVAAGRNVSPITGSDIAQGMLDLISPTAAPYDVGPSDQGNIFTALGQRSQISLVGTLGPPDFDVFNGARVGQGDVYCLQQDDGGVYDYEYDVLRLTNPDGGPGPDGGSALQGTFPCYSGIQ
jgi:hypothetical protein